MNCENAITGSIPRLLFGRGPLCVLRPFANKTLWAMAARIVAFIVDPINGFPFWPFAHVLQKVRKRIQPTLAHENAFGSIAGIGIVFWIVAALFYTSPTCPCLRFYADFIGSRSVSMYPFQNGIGLLQPFGTQFVFPATAGNFDIVPLGISQSTARSYSRFTAVTNAKIERPVSADIFLLDNFKSSNFIPNERYFLRHNIRLVIASGGLSAETDTRCAIPPTILSLCNISVLVTGCIHNKVAEGGSSATFS